MQLFIIVINVRSQSGIYQSLSIIIILMDYLLNCLLIVDNRFNKLKQQGPLYYNNCPAIIIIDKWPPCEY